jgi:hypothetical protein
LAKSGKIPWSGALSNTNYGGDLGNFSQKVAGILRFGAFSPGQARTLPRYYQPYIVGVDRASEDLEFGISFDLSTPLWPEIYVVKKWKNCVHTGYPYFED